MSSKDQCCVPNCAGSGRSHKVLHGFPDPEKYPDRFRIWLYAVGGNILAYSNQYIYKYRKICHNHFEDKYCCRYNRISNIAVPTISMPGTTAMPHFPVVDRQPLKSFNRSMDGASSSKEPVIDEMDPFSIPCPVREQVEKENINPTEPVIDEMDPFSIPCPVREQVEKENINPTECIATLHSPVVQWRSAQFASRATDPLTSAQGETIEAIPTPKNQMRKLSRRISMSATQKSLHQILLSVKARLAKCRSTIRKQRMQIKQAKNIFANPKFVETMENWTTSAKILTLLQYRECKKMKKGRRFTREEKIVSLTLFKHSPKAYRFLRKIFVLPSCQTLIKLVQQCTLSAGINKNIFQQLKTKAQKMKPEHKICSLLFDEMQLKASISFNERNDKIIGFVTNGQETKKILADHAQVFMIRGLVKNYKLPIGYTFSAGATKGIELAKQIKAFVAEVHKAGFKVLATVCDQGTNNRQAIKYLKEETRRNFFNKGGIGYLNDHVFIIDNEEIVPIYDPPHLLKGMRNNLISKDLIYEYNNLRKTAKWHHIQLLYSENPGYKNIRLIPSLTEYHIIPSKINKMKVKYASQIFSKTVASNMGYLAEKRILPAECKDTADLLMLMDNLFDSVNGSYGAKRHGKPLLGPVTLNSPHEKEWYKTIKIFQSMKFVGHNKAVKFVPTLQGWICTLIGMKEIIKKLRVQYNITSFWMRHLNQDSLENFFGAVRSHGCRNTNPTVAQFESAFATLLINNLTSIHAPGANCEQDTAEALKNFVLAYSCEANEPCEVDLNDFYNIQVTGLINKSNLKVLAPLQYICGYFIKESKKNVWKGCQICKNILINKKQLEYIKFREYSERNWLHNPNEDIIKIISDMQDICYYGIVKYVEKHCIKELLKTFITVFVNFDVLSCTEHGEKLKCFFVNKVTRFFLHTYCKNINKIISGKRNVDDDSDALQVLCKEYFNKHRKK